MVGGFVVVVARMVLMMFRFWCVDGGVRRVSEVSCVVVAAVEWMVRGGPGGCGGCFVRLVVVGGWVA